MKNSIGVRLMGQKKSSKKSSKPTEAPSCKQQGKSTNTRQEKILESKRRFVNNTGYQIRTLSNAIIGFCDLLSQENLEQAQKEYVTEIYQASQGLVSLVNNVLDMSRMEIGELIVEKTDCPLGWLLDEIELMVRPSAESKGLVFEILRLTELPANIKTDPARIRQCLVNLVGNAVKYTEQGKVQIEVSLKEDGEGPFVRFDVIDNGVGIEPKRQKTIFEPYAEVEDANESILTSLDLGLTVTSGLAMTNYLVKRLGGSITITSNVGEGSAFSVLIPAGVDVTSGPRLDERYSISETDDDIELPLQQQCSGDVLLVEDEPSNRTVITLLLETIGMQVSVAENGLEAIEKATNEDFDLIFMDIKMPKMNGDEATKILREKGITKPIIALSAGALSDIGDDEIKKVFDAFLAKPVDSRKLYNTICNYIPNVNAIEPGGVTEEPSEGVVEYSDDENIAVELTDDNEPIWVKGENK
jgi:CheY-like chemotaxis protein/nitrogen-specific signal transduction histidine kinase